MIRRTASVVLLLRDGFSGRVIVPTSAIRCVLDGVRVLPIRKTDGYLVLADLEPGDHTMSLRCPGYQEETLRLTVREQGPLEQELDLTPGAGYRFPPDTACLRLTVPGAAAEELWAAMAGRVRLKLAQKKKAGGETLLRVFCAGDPAGLPVPGAFLTIDEANPELVRFLSVREETGELAEPFGKDHARGMELRPARRFRTDEAGNVELLFPQGGEVHLFCRDRLLKYELAPGNQELVWPDPK